MKGGILHIGLLGFIDPQGMVDVPEGLPEVVLSAKQPDAQDNCLYVVRRLSELLVHKVQCFGIVLLLVQDLVGLLEVVIILTLVFLGVHVAAQDSQQHRRQ